MRLVELGDKTITRANQWIYNVVCWLIYPLTFVVCYEVFMRYVFLSPTNWVYDMTWMIYGVFVFLGGAYNLRCGGHVKADILYEKLPPKAQAILDILCYAVLYFPVMFFASSSTFHYFMKAWEGMERSNYTNWQPLVWPCKFILFLSFAMLLLQGVVEVLRAVDVLTRRKEVKE